MKRIGVVVPTLFSRSDYLQESLKAIQKAGEAHVILMGPNVEENSKDLIGLFDDLINEPKNGTLSEKLNFAMRSFPENIDLITWVGDDDLLAAGSLEFLEKEFRNDEELSLIYGACDYIDSDGNKIGQNKSGPWALGLAKIGPFLAPQPGSLFKRSAFQAIGGLDTKLRLAFDYDLFLRLNKCGKAKYTRKTLASFRWHGDSLSVGQRKSSVKEASIVRQKHASAGMRKLINITNPLFEIATYFAGILINQRFTGKTQR